MTGIADLSDTAKLHRVTQDLDTLYKMALRYARETGVIELEYEAERAKTSVKLWLTRDYQRSLKQYEAQ